MLFFFEETEKAISTQEKLFVGTEQECEDQIKNLDLKYPDQPQDLWTLITDYQMELDMLAQYTACLL